MASLSAIDTSVLIEFIDESGDFHTQAASIVESVTSGKLTGIIPHPIFAELYYVSFRIFETIAKVKDDKKKDTFESPSLKAEKLLDWLFKSPNVFVPDNTVELAIEAGKIKQKFHLALPDSYVLASAKLNQCDAIFKSREEEMKHNDKLTKLKNEAKVVFLEDYT